MKFTKALLTGILLWVLIFFEVSILMFGFGIQGITYNIIHYILLLILIVICTLIYFKGAKGGIGQGFLLGIFYLIIGIILDAIITVPLFVKDYYAFFFNWGFVFALIELLVITTFIGAIKR